jgi:hypothetical protein
MNKFEIERMLEKSRSLFELACSRLSTLEISLALLKSQSFLALLQDSKFSKIRELRRHNAAP